jgi:endonuclease/exonuclease/phosphatase family metal-dependent hydrolase
MTHPPRVRFATFNLLHGVPVLDRDRVDGAGSGPAETDPGLLQDAVTTLAGDVLALQEVDVAQPRSGGHHQVRLAAAAMAAEHWRFAPSLQGTPGDRTRHWRPPAEGDAARAARGEPTPPLYGVGMVSRFPVRQWRSTTFAAAPFSLPLLVPDEPRPRLLRIPDEPRAALAAVVETPQGLVTVATAHLSFVPGYNVRQLRALQAWLRDLPRPVILLGDLNLPGRLPALLTGWPSLLRAASYPSTKPRIQFDHVLADGLTAAQRTAAVGQVHRLSVSDHAAVTVDLDVAGPDR